MLRGIPGISVTPTTVVSLVLATYHYVDRDDGGQQLQPRRYISILLLYCINRIIILRHTRIGYLNILGGEVGALSEK